MEQLFPRVLFPRVVEATFEIVDYTALEYRESVSVYDYSGDRAGGNRRPYSTPQDRDQEIR